MVRFFPLLFSVLRSHRSAEQQGLLSPFPLRSAVVSFLLPTRTTQPPFDSPLPIPSSIGCCTTQGDKGGQKWQRLEGPRKQRRKGSWVEGEGEEKDNFLRRGLHECVPKAVEGWRSRRCVQYLVQQRKRLASFTCFRLQLFPSFP